MLPLVQLCFLNGHQDTNHQLACSTSSTPRPTALWNTWKRFASTVCLSFCPPALSVCRMANPSVCTFLFLIFSLASLLFPGFLEGWRVGPTQGDVLLQRFAGLHFFATTKLFEIFLISPTHPSVHPPSVPSSVHSSSIHPSLHPSTNHPFLHPPLSPLPVFHWLICLSTLVVP